MRDLGKRLLHTNLDYFGKKKPSIKSKFSHYLPSHLQLQWGAKSNPVLAVIANGASFFPEDAESYYQKIVSNYCANPDYRQLRFKPQDVLLSDHEAHITHIKKAQNYLGGVTGNAEGLVRAERNCDVVIIWGLGMGLHVPILQEKLRCKHLLLIEPVADCFYASLQLVDWPAVERRAHDCDGSVHYLLAEDPGLLAESVLGVLQDVGLYYAETIYHCRHINNPVLSAAFDKLYQGLGQKLSSLGFFDDERLSLAHTIKNIENRVPILNGLNASRPHFHDEYPALLVGNGPSLDNITPWLVEHADDFIIFSCGTAVGALRKLGIKPTFHVELERTRPTAEWMAASTDEAYRQGITLLALNTLHPDGYELFASRAMGMGGRDLGSRFIQYLNRCTVPMQEMHYSNPTVVNAALSFSINLGFKNCFLLGVDLGYAEGKKHHSEHSVYYSIKPECEGQIYLDERDEAKGPRVPGNFGGTVLSSNLFNHTRLCLEALLAANPEVKCINLSEGVRIEGTEPAHAHDLKLLPVDALRGREFISDLLAKRFSLEAIDPKQVEGSCDDLVDAAMRLISDVRRILEQEVSTECQAAVLLAEHHNFFKPAYQYRSISLQTLAQRMFCGSAAAFALLLQSGLSRGEEGVKHFLVVLQCYKDFYREAESIISSCFLSSDDRYEGVAEMIDPGLRPSP